MENSQSASIFKLSITFASNFYTFSHVCWNWHCTFPNIKNNHIHIFYRQLCAKHKNSNLGDDGASRHQPDPTNQDHRRSAAEHVRLRSGSRDSFFYIYIQYFQEEAAPSRFYISYKKIVLFNNNCSQEGFSIMLNR